MENSQSLSNVIYLIVAGIAMILLLAGIVMVYVSYAQRRLLQQQLTLKEIETEHQQELIHNGIMVLEQERARFSKDLHDDIGSLFSALRLQVKQITPLDEQQKNKELVLSSCDLIDSGMQRLRQISHNIAPPDLEMFGLPDILDTFCEKQSTPQLQLSFHYQHPYRNMGSLPELAVYRVVQELCNNAFRHAEATQIRLQLEQTPERSTFTYSDNGKGFDFDTVYNHPHTGLGLRSITARVHHVQGSLQWQTQPGAGLTVHIQIPA
jgi:signal transduction histidine kinase